MKLSEQARRSHGSKYDVENKCLDMLVSCASELELAARALCYDKQPKGCMETSVSVLPSLENEHLLFISVVDCVVVQV